MALKWTGILVSLPFKKVLSVYPNCLEFDLKDRKHHVIPPSVYISLSIWRKYWTFQIKKIIIYWFNINEIMPEEFSANWEQFYPKSNRCQLSLPPSTCNSSSWRLFPRNGVPAFRPPSRPSERGPKHPILTKKNKKHLTNPGKCRISV